YGERLPGLKALVAFYAPADLDFAYAYSKPDDLLHSRQLEEAYLGGDPRTRAAAYHDASAPRFVTGDAPPTLLLHGPGDPLVWFKQSERLKAKLDAEKVPSALVALPFATHGFDWTPNGPDGQLADGLVAAFLEARLKP
ncbi:MAG TPA: prolyl oligopeptidase family serine peptidase, partial [Holophagaceae bacterium]|nr:prolyl oligopeptidase family serine peptidase [Holophagaceae bacterium]